MSDQRTAVAQAIQDARKQGLGIFAQADAALSAIDAAEPPEPTDAEVEAANQAFIRAFADDGLDPVDAMRAALIAARKVLHED